MGGEAHDHLKDGIVSHADKGHALGARKGGGGVGVSCPLQADKGEYLCSLERRLELLNGLLALLQMSLSLLLC